MACIKLIFKGFHSHSIYFVKAHSIDVNLELRANPLLYSPSVYTELSVFNIDSGHRQLLLQVFQLLFRFLRRLEPFVQVRNQELIWCLLRTLIFKSRSLPFFFILFIALIIVLILVIIFTSHIIEVVNELFFLICPFPSWRCEQLILVHDIVILNI